QRRARPLDQCADESSLVAGGEIGSSALQLVRREVANDVQQRGLQSREREVKTGNARNREVVRGRVALSCEPVELRAAGIAQAEQPRAFVKGFSRRVVERRADHVLRAVVGDVEQKRMTAAGEQAEERRLDR